MIRGLPMKVSILAHAEARALPGIVSGSRYALKFQSSPTPKRGRYPGIKQQREPADPVSILAHAEARALLPYSPGCRWSSSGFNPRPRRSAGATRPEPILNQSSKVSILAHAEARALLTMTTRTMRRLQVFQSSPTPKRGRYEVSTITVPQDKDQGFNPRPRRSAGAT